MANVINLPPLLLMLLMLLPLLLLLLLLLLVLVRWWWLLLLLLLLRSGITAAVYCSRFGGEQPIGHSPAERGTDGVTDGPLAGKSRVGG